MSNELEVPLVTLGRKYPWQPPPRDRSQGMPATIARQSSSYIVSRNDSNNHVTIEGR